MPFAFHVSPGGQPGGVLGGALALLGQATLPGAPGPLAPPPPSFQKHVFWAYGCACGLIFLFALMSLWQERSLRRRLDDLEERFARAHPEAR